VILLSSGKGRFFMSKKNELPDPETMDQDELYKFEIAMELGLGEKVLTEGWRALTAKESGRLGGILASRRKREKNEGE
jgi:hypothetical protein